MRKILAAAVSVSAFVTMSFLGVGSASAATYHHVCRLDQTGYCLWSAGFNRQVQAKYFNWTNFSQVNKATWQKHTVYEYKQAGTNNCLSYQSGTEYVVMETCAAGNPLELWWDDTNNGGFMVSDYGTYDLGQQACLEDQGTGNSWTADVFWCAGLGQNWALG